MTMPPTYFPSPPQGVWHLGPLPLRAYALFIIIGIVAALLIGDRRWEARGGERGVIYDIALWAVPFGLVGGRLYHLATDWQTYWGPGGAGFGAALRIWDGGLGIWGAIALGGVGAWIGCRRRGIPLPAFADAVAPGVVLAQAIGRLGNYFNQELYGRETTLPWGLQIFYRRDPSGYVDPHSLDGVSTGQVALVVQPTFLYELIWNVLVFVALIYVDRRFKLGHGRLFASYVAAYCVGRFCVELLRDDTATHIAGIRINSFTSTFVFIGAVVYLILAPKGREDPESLRGKDYAEEPEEPALEPEPADELAAIASGPAATTAAGVVAADDGEPADSAETAESAAAVEPETEEAAEAEAGEPETEAEQPVAEAGEPEAKEPEAEEAEEPEAEEVEEAEAGEPEAEEPKAEEAEESKAEEAEEAEAGEPEAKEPKAEEAEEAEAEEPAAEEVTSEEPEAKEPEAEEPVAENAAEEAPTGEGDKGTWRRWLFGVRKRRSAEAEEPEGEEPEAEEPEAVEPEAEAGEPEAEEVKSEEPVVEKAAEDEEPEAVEPEAEAEEPEAEEPEAVEPEAEAEEPEAEEPEAVEPEAEAEEHEAKEPEAEEVKSEEPEAEAEEPEEEEPEADAEEAEEEEPEAEEPEAEAEEPEAKEAKSEEPVAEQAVEEASTGESDRATWRRVLFGVRNRRSGR